MRECKFLAADLLTRQLVDSFTDHLKDDKNGFDTTS